MSEAAAKSSERIAEAGGALLLAACVAAFFGLRLAAPGGEIGAWGDAFLYYYPQYESFYARFARGEIPLWNPYQLAGVPWLAALQAGALYPSHVLYMLLPTNLAMALSGLLHLLLAALATALLARRLRLGVGAALLAALLFTLRGRLPAQLSTPNMLEAAAWLAPGLLALHALARGGGPRSVAALAACSGMSLLAGYPQVTVYSVYAWAALLLVFLVAERAGVARSARAAAGFAVALALGALLATAQLVPTFEVAAEASRDLGGLSRDEMFPLGSDRGVPLGLPELSLRTESSGLLFSLGLAGLVLLPLAPLGRPRRALALGVLGTGLFALAVSFGHRTPLFELYLRLPLVDSFRLPQRILFVFDFCFALAAAIGLDELRRRVSGAGRGTTLAAVLTGAVVSLAAAELFLADAKWPQLPYRRHGYASVWHTPRASYTSVAASDQRVLLWTGGILPELPSKLGSVFGMRVVDDYEPMNLRRQAEYLAYLEKGDLERRFRQRSSGRLRVPADVAAARKFASRRRLLDLAAVGFVLVSGDRALGPVFGAYAEAAGLEPIATAEPDLRLFRNPHALPRAFVTPNVARAPSPAQLLAILSDPRFDPLALSYVEGDAGLPPPDRSAARGRPAAIVREEPTLVEVEAELEAPALLVLADAWFPAWRASVDGRPVEILPANHLFRGVALPAGRHRVRFEYRAGSAVLGACGSALGLLALVGLLRPRPRRQGRAASSTGRRASWWARR